MTKFTTAQFGPQILSGFFSVADDLAGGVPSVKAQFNGLMDTTHALIGVYDPEDILRYANPAFREAFFVDADEGISWPDMMRRNYMLDRGTVLKTDDIESWITSVESRRGKIDNRSFETDLQDGRWIWALETVQPNGWMLYVGLDMTAVRTDERELRMDRDYALKASHTDDLTGVSNRRHIMDMLAKVIEGATAKRVKGGCVCLFDIDYFKRINDTFGHQTGDQVLSGFARTLRDGVRLADGLGRVGGEEFLLIMPGIGLRDGTDIVQRVYETLAVSSLVPQAPDQCVTCSAGLTEITPVDTPEAVYRRCDELLYAAKDGGRNQLSISRGSPP